MTAGTRSRLSRLRHLARRRPHADIAMAIMAFLATVLTTGAGSPRHGLDPAAGMVAAIACGALIARRWSPILAFLVSASAAEAYLILYHGNQGAMVLAAPLIALYTVAEQTTGPRALVIGGVAVVVLAGSHLMNMPSARLSADNLALVALGALAVAAGNGSRNRRDLLRAVEDRASRAERDRETEAARRVAEERLRIARELHDVVGHHLALINVQAGVANHVFDTQPAKAREALGHIRATSRVALGELRDTVGLLRQPEESPVPTEPVVGLGELPHLLAAFRRAGLVVREQVVGQPREVTAAVDIAAYRIVQESLTNVRKHAGSGTVELTLTYQTGALEIIVGNEPGPGPHKEEALGGSGTGHGLAGMRERVAALGGVIAAGPSAEGGFRVVASLPTAVATNPSLGDL